MRTLVPSSTVPFREACEIWSLTLCPDEGTMRVGNWAENLGSERLGKDFPLLLSRMGWGEASFMDERLDGGLQAKRTAVVYVGLS